MDVFPLCSCLKKPLQGEKKNLDYLSTHSFLKSRDFSFLFSFELAGTEGPCGTLGAPSLFSIFQRAEANLPIMSLESEDEVPDNMTNFFTFCSLFHLN